VLDNLEKNIVDFWKIVYSISRIKEGTKWKK
jgi:hypothetical protein